MLRRPADLQPQDFPIQPRAVGSFAEVEPLLKFCSYGKLYETEEWLAKGHPVQYPPSDDRKLRRRQTALQIAVGKGFHSLAALLLANGYNPNADYYECLSPPVRAKDREMVDLLLRFGADADAVDFCEVLETCDRWLMDRFISAGVDPCRKNAVARALYFKGRPILGFIKQYRERFPGLQRQIDIALHEFTKSDDVRGVALMLWLGANPHAKTPASAYEEDQASGLCDTAFESALYARKPEVLDMVTKKPIPADRVSELFQTVAHQSRPDLVKRLLDQGADPNYVGDEGYHILHTFVHTVLWRFSRSAEETERGLQALELVLKSGAKWTLSEQRLKRLRREMIDGESKVVIRVLEMMTQYGGFTAEQFWELTRTPSMKRVLAGVTKPTRDYWSGLYTPSQPSTQITPAPGTSRGYWKKHWSQQ